MGSAPLTADQMLAALKKWGIAPKFYKPDWRTHNRGQRGGGWGPINGFLIHNFASDISDASSLAYLYNGDNARGMPGPLSQFAIDDKGDVWVIGWGRANHGGSGDPGFVEALAYDRLSLTSDYKPKTSGSVDMNSRTYGVEMLYGKAPTQAQRNTVVRLAAALMDAHGYAATSVGGHRESTTQRSDPVGFEMGELRRQVQALLRFGPGTTLSKPVATAPQPVPKSEEDELMTLQIKNPATGELWPADKALYSMWYYAFNGYLNSQAALAVAKQAAEKGQPLTAAETEAIVKAAIAEGVQVTGTLNVQPKPGA